MFSKAPSTFKLIDDLNVVGQRVLVRVDFNVPIKDGKVSDLTRIQRTIPTLKELSKKGARVILMSHFGRPKGRVVKKMSLKPIALALSSILGGKPVKFITDCIGDEAAEIIAQMNNGDFAMLENLRFHGGEESNDKNFTQKLAALGDLYVSDAFSTSHRSHASTESIANLLPSAAGRLMQSEVEALSGALESPEKPVVAIVGGAKVSTKLEVLGNLSSKVNTLIIGGAMANTFLYAQGINVGKSLYEKNMEDSVQSIIKNAKLYKCEIVLPVDVVVAEKLECGTQSKVVPFKDVPEELMILDIGPKSIGAINSYIKNSKTLVWNGPLGAFEISPFDLGTNSTAKVAAHFTSKGHLTSVAGGGDTIAALNNASVINDFSYISTAGGAFLEWLEGKNLPGVSVLRKNHH